MKYKVDDKIKIRSWDSMEQEYGLDKDGDIKIYSCFFMVSMKKHCEKTVTISKIIRNCYRIKEHSCAWTDEMIDHVATKIMSIIDRLEMLKNLTNVVIIKDTIDITILTLRSDNPYFAWSDVVYFNKLFYDIKRRNWQKT